MQGKSKSVKSGVDLNGRGSEGWVASGYTVKKVSHIPAGDGKMANLFYSVRGVAITDGWSSSATLMTSQSASCMGR